MNWYVLYTKPRSEKKVEEKLLSLGINAYCPTYSEIRFWSDRKKKNRSSGAGFNSFCKY